MKNIFSETTKCIFFYDSNHKEDGVGKVYPNFIYNNYDGLSRYFRSESQSFVELGAKRGSLLDS